MKYYVRDTKGRVAGPFSVEDIKKAADEGRILPTWHLSSTQERWTLAAKVQDLFPPPEVAPPIELPPDPRPSPVHDATLGLFLDTFKGGEDRLRDAWPWAREARLWWIKLTRPSNGFIITDVGPKGVTRRRYEFANVRPAIVSDEEYERTLKAAMGRLDWYVAFALLVAVAGGIWALSDFGDPPNRVMAVAKLAAIPILLALGYVHRSRRSRLFLGYVLAPEIENRLKELRDAFGVLSRCSRVWAVRLRAADSSWKYGIGGRIGHLPAANLGRSLPNIRTNITIPGVALYPLAIYFFPEGLVVADGSDVRHVAYGQMETSQDHVDYLHTGWQRYSDSPVVGYRWLHSRVNGQPDRRYNVNYQIPIVRLGILALGVPEALIGLITTDPNAPATFRRNLPSP